MVRTLHRWCKCKLPTSRDLSTTRNVNQLNASFILRFFKVIIFVDIFVKQLLALHKANIKFRDKMRRINILPGRENISEFSSISHARVRATSKETETSR